MSFYSRMAVRRWKSINRYIRKVSSATELTRIYVGEHEFAWRFGQAQRLLSFLPEPSSLGEPS